LLAWDHFDSIRQQIFRIFLVKKQESRRGMFLLMIECEVPDERYLLPIKPLWVR